MKTNKLSYAEVSAVATGGHVANLDKVLSKLNITEEDTFGFNFSNTNPELDASIYFTLKWLNQEWLHLQCAVFDKEVNFVQASTQNWTDKGSKKVITEKWVFSSMIADRKDYSSSMEAEDL